MKKDGVKMTDEEKQKECSRICGDAGKRGAHSCAPELCPILEDEWKGKKQDHKYGSGRV